MLSKPAIADFPSPELLKDLKTRLMSPPECLPDCAQIQRMKLNIEPFLMEIWLEIHATEAVAVPVPAAADQWFPKNVALNGAAANSLFKSDKGELYIQLDKGIHQVVLSGPLPQKNNVDLPLPLKPHHVTVTANGWLVKGVRENGLAEDQLQLSRIQPDEQKQIESLKPIEPTIFPPFVQVERILHFGLDWTVETRLTRISPPDMAAVIEVPLIAGESVTTQGIRVSEGKVLVNMSPSQRSMVWRSVLKKEKDITIAAPDTSSWIEVWRSDVSCIWHTDYSGISVIHHQDPNGRWLPEWHPWPGERITLKIIRPEGVKGQTITINSSRISVKPGRRATDTELKIAINSSQGGQHVLLLPKDAELEDVFINGIAQPVRQEGRKVAMPIVPGEQNIELSWRSDKSISNVFQTPEVDLLVPSVNHSIDAEMGQDRWVLWVAGPKLGPAVLFWGELIIILIISLGLGQIKLTPLKSFQWLLLGIGLSQTTVIGALLVVGWLCALGFRKNMNVDVKEGRFNLTQSGIVILTISALGSLFMAVEKGLLGMPEMQVTGNNSSAFMLHWFQDRVAGMLPVAVVLSVPLKIYRLIMLLWALWLAFSMVSWLKWGWQCFASNGIWKRTTLLKRKKNAEIQDPPDSNGDQDF
jgi:hypothetical protein